MFTNVRSNVFTLLSDYYKQSKESILYVDSKKSYSVEDVYENSLSIANSLRKLGISKNPIIVLVNREARVLITFFGIAASNNIYLPVDEDIPEEKLKDILSSSKAKYYFSFNDRRIASLTYLDFEELSKNVDLDEDVLTLTKENDPLYLMFTSGSTGKAKGVLKSHENILSFVDSFKESFPFIEDDQKLMNQTPFFFDASSKDIYLTLKYHGTLYIPEKNTFSLPQVIINYLNENQISMILWVPSVLTLIAKLRTLDFMKPEYLKYIFFVGEVFQNKYLNMWVKAMPQTRFFNIYGSTELAGVALEYEVKKEIPLDQSLPTGKPLIGNEVFLEDGEICIKSHQVALGYINDDERNAKTFKHENGDIILHTGDYATYDDEGNILFLTRKDFQIKHLGYRIELQEIDHALSSLTYIDTCVALFDKTKDKIVLFATLNKTSENPIKMILDDAKSKLQFYMLPNKVIILDKMPMNNNGKIDRTALMNMLGSK